MGLGSGTTFSYSEEEVNKEEENAKRIRGKVKKTSQQTQELVKKTQK